MAFSDWNYYYTKDIVGWRSDTSPARTVSVPVGFVTDLASTPSLLWTFLPKTAEYSYPAIIHDYLYWFQPCERKDADDVLKSAMEDLDVATAKIVAVYGGVRAGGESAWEANAAARAKGEKRVLKKFPTDMKTSWEEWKKRPDVF
ncbi:DUF1353 domain-containing protein [Mesorhizobium carmichaelinearum]|uniref:DUF1353 domain-containing protein n=1 Tax=Mesorhizobium carmichaelinearum TaxID=1208188 RepID=UPI0015C9FD15|nr:DUF1353 domain-containing protein [Mesorhizobium carmichaelinearum]